MNRNELEEKNITLGILSKLHHAFLQLSYIGDEESIRVIIACMKEQHTGIDIEGIHSQAREEVAAGLYEDVLKLTEGCGSYSVIPVLRRDMQKLQLIKRKNIIERRKNHGVNIK
jgi:hypothetical protein